jgi:hypothetical protein
MQWSPPAIKLPDNYPVTRYEPPVPDGPFP